MKSEQRSSTDGKTAFSFALNVCCTQSLKSEEMFLVSQYFLYSCDVSSKFFLINVGEKKSKYKPRVKLHKNICVQMH